MIIDLILDRKDGKQYNAHDFYMDCMEYGGSGIDISRAMDCGTESDVKAALCAYIDGNQYNPEIKDYINNVYWIDNDPSGILESLQAHIEQKKKTIDFESVQREVRNTPEIRELNRQIEQGKMILRIFDKA